MLFQHKLSGEQLFVVTDAGGNPFSGSILAPHGLYNCRRFTLTDGYTLVSVYGMELQPIINQDS